MFRATDFFAIFACLTLWALAPASSAIAQVPAPPPPRSIFTINNVPVDVTSNSAAAARQSAIAQSRRIAFSQIFSKLVAREDLALEPALTNAELADLVRAIDVTDERSSATRYVAALSVSFDAEKLTALLERLNVTFTDSQTPPISLVPIAHYGGLPLLHSPDNVWLIAWQRSPTRAASLVDYVLPDPGPLYKRHISALSARQAPPQALIDLITLQKARDVLLAFADIRLDMATRRYVGTFDIRRGPGQAPFMSFELSQESEETPQEMLERAIAAVDGELSALWKRQLLVEFSQARNVSVIAQFEAAQDWQAIRAVLSSSRRLRNVRVPSLTLRRADITARFFGSFDALEEAFALRGLRLVDEGADQWRIRTMTDMEAAIYGEAASGNKVQFVDPLADQTQGDAAPEQVGEDGQDPLTDMDVPPWELSQPARRPASLGDVAP
ncbi:MAG: DUF2066 domain-containing protein [Pseudomonadota bacterium]